MPKKVLIAFGSPSDMPKEFDFPRTEGVNYYFSVASAHRTPDVAEKHAQRDWGFVIACAGMCNALKDVYLRHSDCPVLAVPMHDSRTGGLSGILSSMEMPPGYPVAAGRMGDVNAAVNFANEALSRNYKSVFLGTDDSPDADRVMTKADEMLKSLGVTVSDSGLSVFAYTKPETLSVISEPTVCCYGRPFKLSTDGPGTEEAARFLLYLDAMQKNPNCVHTGVADGGNLGLYAAQIIAMNDGDVAARIKEHRTKGREKYKGFENVILIH